MKPIADANELRRWVDLSGDDDTQAFELKVSSDFPFLSFTDYGALFLPGTIEAGCRWSRRNGMKPFAMFFTRPDPKEYFEESGIYAGITVDGSDEPASAEDLLTSGNRWDGVFSIYDASHRFTVLPVTRNWMLIGDRDADLAIFGFDTATAQQAFIDNLGFEMFESDEDAASHARSFMNYELGLSVCRR